MNFKSNKGFSLMELIIVVALVAIVGTPIVQGIIGSIRQSAKTKAMQDATVIAQDICETIEAQGPGYVFPDPVKTPEQIQDELDDGTVAELTKSIELDNIQYEILCKKSDPTALLAIDSVNTGGYAIEGYKKYYFINAIASNIIQYSIVETIDDGTTTTSVPSNLSMTGATNNDFSLVFYDNKIGVFRNEKFSSAAIKGDLIQEYGEFGGPTCPNNNVRLTNNTGAPINVNLYNVSSQEAHVFYNSEDSEPQKKINLYFKHDTNIITHKIDDLDISFDSHNIKDAKTYEIKIKKVTEPVEDDLLTRIVTYIKEN